jgi:hypothetical protein
MPNIDDYKAKFGYGNRKNLYNILFTLPTIIKNIQAEEHFNGMVQEVAMPWAREIETETINVAGDYFNVAKDKNAEEDITVKFRDTENLILRNIIELWIDVIQQDITGVRTIPDEYKSPYFIVEQLNHLKEVTRRVQIIGAFPQKMDRIEYNMSEGGISECSIVMKIDAHKILPLT